MGKKRHLKFAVMQHTICTDSPGIPVNNTILSSSLAKQMKFSLTGVFGNYRKEKNCQTKIVCVSLLTSHQGLGFRAHWSQWKDSASTGFGPDPHECSPCRCKLPRSFSTCLNNGCSRDPPSHSSVFLSKPALSRCSDAVLAQWLTSQPSSHQRPFCLFTSSHMTCLHLSPQCSASCLLSCSQSRQNWQTQIVCPHGRSRTGASCVWQKYYSTGPTLSLHTGANSSLQNYLNSSGLRMGQGNGTRYLRGSQNALFHFILLVSPKQTSFWICHFRFQNIKWGIEGFYSSYT